jgi:plasmid stability protein
MSVLNLRGFPDDLHHSLRVAAAKRNTSIKALLITAAREWLERAGELPQEGKREKGRRRADLPRSV